MVRIPINVELIATVAAVAVIGLTVSIIGFSASLPNHYLVYPILAAMAAPVVVYIVSNRGRTRGATIPVDEAPSIEEEAPEQVEQASPNEEDEQEVVAPVRAKSGAVSTVPAPVAVAPAVVAPPSPPVDVLSERLAAIESRLAQVVELSNSILTNTSRPPLAETPAIAGPRQSGAAVGAVPAIDGQKRVIMKLKQSDIKDETSQDEVEDLRTNGPLKTGRGRTTKEDDVDEDLDSEQPLERQSDATKNTDSTDGPSPSPSADGRKPPPAPMTRAEELNILREELIKLRSKLDVGESRQK